MENVATRREGQNGGVPVLQEMKYAGRPVNASDAYIYKAAVSASRPAMDYTARVIPHFDGVAVLLEESRILW